MARHMRNGRDYSRPGPKVDYELRKDSNNAARSGEVYDKIEEIQSSLSDIFIKKMKLLGRSSYSNVVNLNESFKNYDAIYVSSFIKTTGDTTKASTSIFAFSEDINVGDKITLVEESAYDRWYKTLLTISSETSFTTNNGYYTTVIGINLWPSKQKNY